MMKKLVASALVVGAASAAAARQQQVMKDTPRHSLKGAIKSAFADLAESDANDYFEKLKAVDANAVEAWDAVASEYPEAMSKVELLSRPKAHTRRPDHHWDVILKGADVQKVRTRNDAGEDEPELDGKLDTYTLRARSVDPGKLGIDPGVKQYSGYLDDDEDDKHLFYWFFESRNDPKNDPVVLWLNGGPGCSSLTGLFMELGPSFIDKDRKARYNPYSWNSNASVIFLDQPVNVGFSYSDGSVSNTAAAGKDVYALLTLFFKQFPEYATQDFHIAGESYGGHYLPIFTAEILSHRKRNINLKSILIGNGLTDELVQYPYYRPMACGDGGWPAVLDEPQCRAMDHALPRCLGLIEGCYGSESVWSCVPAAIYCNNAIIGPYQRTGRNPYDVRRPCGDNPLCYEDLDWISDFLNRRDVQDALGVEVHSYDTCNFDINRNFLFQGDWMLPIQRAVPAILEEVPILVYAGDTDFICNWLGNRAWTEALEWHGKPAYNAEPTKNLTRRSNVYGSIGDSVGDSVDVSTSADGGKVVGSVKSSGNLTFVRLFAGGHMIPHDQPEASLDVFNRWLQGEWWET